MNMMVEPFRFDTAPIRVLMPGGADSPQGRR
jgi:hypothetical protein